VAPDPDRAPRLRLVDDDDVYQDWESAYRDNVVGIYRYIYRRIGNHPDAEDLTGQTFLNTLRTLRLPAPVHDARAYLVKTAQTVLADHWRRHYAMPVVPMDLSHLVAVSAAAAESRRTAERAAKILALLPDRPRQLLELRFLRGYSVREAAEEMGMTETNVKVTQYRALRKAAQTAEGLPE
jgi:RNA polymerase sigma factor (sigma-70 family)